MSKDKEIQIEVGSLWVSIDDTKWFHRHLFRFYRYADDGLIFKYLPKGKSGPMCYRATRQDLNKQFAPYTPHPSSKAWMEDESK